MINAENNKKKTKIQAVSTSSLDGEKSSSEGAPISKPTTFRMPTSSVLSRVMDFLPKLQQSNVDLQKQIEAEGQDKVSLEEISPDQGKVIEMDVQLGVLEEKQDALTEEEVAERTHKFLFSSGSSSSEHDEDDENEEDEGKIVDKTSEESGSEVIQCGKTKAKKQRAAKSGKKSVKRLVQIVGEE